MNSTIAHAAATRSIEEISVGDRLPDLPIDLTPTLIVSTAIASRDYQDVHHDRDRAQRAGNQDIFMNILTTNGLVGRYVTDWTGPNVHLRDVRIRLGAPNYPYDTMVLRGEVTEVDPGASRIAISVTGDNGIGTHVTGSVTVEIPR